MASRGTPSPSRLSLGRRAFVLGVALAMTALEAEAACRPIRVLFVCPAGSVKSAIAREALKRRAAAEGLTVRVSSRGVHPEDHVSPDLAANLRRVGLDPASEPLRALTPGDVADADLVVAFDEAADEPMLGQARAWRTPSWNGDFDAAKTDLDTRLDALSAELRLRTRPPCGVKDLGPADRHESRIR